MGSQLAANGAQATLNYLSGYAFPIVSTTTPSSWYPGIIWVNGTGSVKDYNGTTWSTVTSAPRYLALLTADPATSGSGGTAAVNISDLAEVTTTGYARQPVTFSAATGYPAVCSNTGVITFGQFTAPMTSATAWAALVTASTGTAGYLICTWDLTTSQQVSTGQSIEFAPSNLVMDQE